MLFIDACYKNDIELAKTCQIPDQDTLNDLFIGICKIGHLEIAKWLYDLGVDISYNDNYAFISACQNGNLEVAQWLNGQCADISTKYNDAFIWVCVCGYLDIAKWLHNLGVNIYYKDNDAFISACSYGHLKIAQWLHGLGANISAKHNSAFIWACANGHLHVAQWLHSLDVSDQNNYAIRKACHNNQFITVKWLIDIHYKYGGYIKFNNYDDFSDRIKNSLIDHNLIDPSTLSKSDLTYYLARTDNFVPPDFTTPHEGFIVKYRGKHTKPAPRE